MSKAFITTNPLLPAEYYVPKGVDQFVIDMNRHVEHSLLDCPGRYTVQVAHFTGRTTLDQAEIQQIEQGAKVKGSRLAKAADKAHRLTEALRMKGYEAYEFHDRYASLVTVGSFDSVGAPRADGKIEINPEIHTIMELFGAKPATGLGASAGALQPGNCIGIPYDIQPIPVEVPKRAVSAVQARKISRLW